MRLIADLHVIARANSLRMTVPVEVVRELKLKAGDLVEVGLTDSTMIVKKAK